MFNKYTDYISDTRDEYIRKKSMHISSNINKETIIDFFDRNSK